MADVFIAVVLALVVGLAGYLIGYLDGRQGGMALYATGQAECLKNSKGKIVYCGAIANQ